MARAAIAAGADGLIVEMHPNPSEALCDGPQSLTPENFKMMMDDLKKIAGLMGRKMP
ncbi:MAG: Phospho-2-dehydro-3-deoxyheptonate aldolase [Firmicutes bacterium ADurb.Bin373]|nr:MAG: Phospho-2-dehydro-3-deoxyheptonate aldolase [Firmicutes bacterium ADurb.Bin373]